MTEQFVQTAPFFLTGIGTTLLYTVLGAVAALVLSFVFGLMSLSRSVAVRGFSRVVVEFFRGTSLVIQLLWIFFVLPQLGIRFEPIAAATIAFGLNFGAYGAEIVRGAVTAVPKAQWEATVALGLGRMRRMRRVILPQALPEMIPPFGNLWIQILKSSSLLYLIGITELTYEVKQLQFDIGSLAAFSIALVVYFLIAQLLVLVVRWVEKRAAARVGRGGKAVVIEQPQAVSAS
ncbi:ectoine/hydroxyectoine ABC transporter permease subunit EhuC [[Mycobacterium] wendilense]|uniref:Ectoine/hydroxyectoine ABC transporter permease subunit EhuC n=1 Tax=[Mycobacterium] wendilense TaxID=3064284 RepID=A0ABM9MBV0_9MYCO|nr:ectoine/hydroxyectoine ABC transporter permease subunit EhuC [Mycolicibacterium sp. MU0050]CAJ1581400.1 ectoine/hydroxyectoine ABC transporter permease subunit EhuC [Mycolicibacterium sp. MU0050]